MHPVPDSVRLATQLVVVALSLGPEEGSTYSELLLVGPLAKVDLSTGNLPCIPREGRNGSSAPLKLRLDQGVVSRTGSKRSARYALKSHTGT